MDRLKFELSNVFFTKGFEELHFKMRDNIIGAGDVKNVTISTCEKTEGIDEKKEDTIDNSRQNKNLPEPEKIIGCDIYMEIEGVKSLGTVTDYIRTMNLFQVEFEYDNRIDYLELDVIMSNMAKKEEFNRVQQLSHSRNTLEKAVESEMNKAALEETSTSKNKRGKGSSVASSSGVVKKSSPWFSNRVNATGTEPYELYQFMGLYICREHNGRRCLGTVVDYDLEKNKLIVQYKVDGMKEYLTQKDALYSMAKREDFSPAQPTPSSRV